MVRTFEMIQLKLCLISHQSVVSSQYQLPWSAIMINLRGGVIDYIRVKKELCLLPKSSPFISTPNVISGVVLWALCYAGSDIWVCVFLISLIRFQVFAGNKTRSPGSQDRSDSQTLSSCRFCIFKNIFDIFIFWSVRLI